MAIVAAGVLRNDVQQVLIVRRAPGQLPTGYWEFPGGKVESTETEWDCLRRELKEESSIHVSVGRFFYESRYAYGHGELLLKAFEVQLTVGSRFLMPMTY